MFCASSQYFVRGQFQIQILLTQKLWEKYKRQAE